MDKRTHVDPTGGVDGRTTSKRSSVVVITDNDRGPNPPYLESNTHVSPNMWEQRWREGQFRRERRAAKRLRVPTKRDGNSQTVGYQCSSVVRQNSTRRVNGAAGEQNLPRRMTSDYSENVFLAGPSDLLRVVEERVPLLTLVRLLT